MTQPADSARSICSYGACDYPADTAGLCSAHYVRSRTGHPPMDAPMRRRVSSLRDAVERGLPNPLPPDDHCWEWQRHRFDGYGHQRYNGRSHPAHRLAYELFVGPVPDGLCIDHLCRNRACVNPAHLEPVTWGENSRRGLVKTICKRGHDLTDEANIYRTPSKRRGQCRKCRTIAARELKAARRSAGVLGVTSGSD